MLQMIYTFYAIFTGSIDAKHKKLVTVYLDILHILECICGECESKIQSSTLSKLNASLKSFFYSLILKHPKWLLNHHQTWTVRLPNSPYCFTMYRVRITWWSRSTLKAKQYSCSVFPTSLRSVEVGYIGFYISFFVVYQYRWKNMVVSMF